MKPEEIHLKDLLRILVGEVPATYFIELLIRAVVVYLILMLSMRLMGKRMSSQLSRNEMAALVSLAAAVGIPMMSPDRGLLPAVVIAFVLVTIERIIALRSFRNEKFEKLAQGSISTLVSDGVIDMMELKRVSLSHERVLAQLRSQEVIQLGTVARFYMEANGTFTLVTNSEPSAGLPILPPWDNELLDQLESPAGIKVCMQCGYPQKASFNNETKCPNCGIKKWIPALKEPEEE